jgi:hypothetical protein
MTVAAREKGSLWLSWSARCLAAWMALSSCRQENETAPSVRVQALTAAPVPAPKADDTACDFVEREARKLNASLPKRLDEDTAATRVSALGCDLTLEYQMLNLSAEDVSPSGLHAMRARVVEQLCADTAARATLERGGTFTNLYLDQSRAPIGHFTVRVRDCSTAQRTVL